MAVRTNQSAQMVVDFGPFRLSAAERLLLRGGSAVALGARALDLLIALVNASPATVSKKELISQVWPDVTVDEGNLRFHIAALRKALGDGEAGARFVETIAGRGYAFVAPLSHGNDAEPTTDHQPTRPRLPALLRRMVGRNEQVEAIATHLLEKRFVTLVGPGGVGKTTVAVAVGHKLLEAFQGAVLFVDLSEVGDPSLAPSAVASIFGLSVPSTDPTPGLLSFLRTKRMLIVLDNCEHVIGAAATLAEAIFQAAPQTHLLATSREYLWVEGEHVSRLLPLECPPEGLPITALEALSYPAVQLFAERATACRSDFRVFDGNVSLISDICRKLDGLALAIELAASRVEAYGLMEISTLLDGRLTSIWQGRRTAPARQQTLQAMLDWSFDLLDVPERIVLYRLSIFVGSFSLDAAKAVAGFGDVEEGTVLSCVRGLVAKSLVNADTRSSFGRYRLMETTRAHALKGLSEAGELDAASRRVVVHYIETLGRTVSDRSANRDHLGNIRAALEWSFSAPDESVAAVALAVAATPLFLELSLLTECCRWTERAIGLLDETGKTSECEMELQAGLGLSLMFTQGNGNATRAALERALHLAEVSGDRLNELRLLGRLHIFEERLADFGAAFVYAERSQAVAEEIDDPVGEAAASSLLGISHHLIGNHEKARAALEVALKEGPTSQRINTLYFGFDHRNRARIALARTLWLQGYADQAIAVARETVAEAAALDHPVTICIALIWAVSVFLWAGDHESASEYIDRFAAHAEVHSFSPYKSVAICVKGELALMRGEAESGIRALEEGLERLHAGRYELLTTGFNSSLAEGLAAVGRFEDALALIEATILSVQRNGDLFTLPELFRLKARILMLQPDRKPEQAEVLLEKALDVSRQQGARAWTLRAAIDLAELWREQGRSHAAWELLSPVTGSFSEGFDTADLRAAARLLEACVSPCP